MKQTSIIFLILTLCLPLWAQSPKHEVRAVWLTTIGGIDWPHSFANSPQAVEQQKQELRDILDRLKKGGGISTMKSDDLCRILSCRVEDVIEYRDEK